MKKIATTILRKLGRVLGVLALCSFAAAGTAFADSITKTFEFGAGSALLRSVFKTFPVPCRKAVTVTVKFRRLGTAGLNNDIPILIELREPNTAPDQEGPVVGEIRSATSRTSEQTVTLSGPAGINRGCSLPWRVRVRHALDATAPFVTTGSIKVDFDSAARNINFPINLTIVKGGSESKTVDLGAFSCQTQGTIVLKGNWVHSVIGLAEGPNPIKLKFELINPNGTVVKTAEGYADRPYERQLGRSILTLVYQVTSSTREWKLRITNLDVDDTVYVYSADGTLTPACP